MKLNSISRNTPQTVLSQPTRAPGSSAVVRPERFRETSIWSGGSLIALFLIVACAGCAASRNRQCDDGCGVRGPACGSAQATACRSGTCGPGAWRAGYWSTRWRPLLTECEWADAALSMPSAPIPTSDDQIPMPQPAVVPFQDDPVSDGASAASGDLGPLLPQTPVVVRAAGRSPLPRPLSRPPRMARPAGPHPSILPATVEATDDPFEVDTDPRPGRSASAPATYQPLAWVPTEQQALQFKEMPSSP